MLSFKTRGLGDTWLLISPSRVIQVNTVLSPRINQLRKGVRTMYIPNIKRGIVRKDNFSQPRDKRLMPWWKSLWLPKANRQMHVTKRPLLPVPSHETNDLMKELVPPQSQRKNACLEKTTSASLLSWILCLHERIWGSTKTTNKCMFQNEHFCQSRNIRLMTWWNILRLHKGNE